jgi:hypothetical protein
MYEIKDVPISLIDSNRHRDLKTYPWIERKVEQLMYSITDVGFWAGAIARPHSKRYELAFGHHRLEAAERLKLKTIPLIIAALTDQQMLQYMGRENGEDYSTDFLIMLNTWEGAVKFLANSRGSPNSRAVARKPLDLAILLGWTRLDPDRDHSPRLSDLASACHSAHTLIQGGYLSRDDLSGLAVRAAEDIVTRAQRRMEQMEELARQNKAPVRDVEEAKKHIGKAAVETAKAYIKGDVAGRDLKSHLDLKTYRYAREAKLQSPLFASFGRALIEQIERMINTDGAADKLAEVRKALGDLTENADKQVVERIDLALAQLSERAENWRGKLHPGKKIVPLVPITGKGA